MCLFTSNKLVTNNCLKKPFCKAIVTKYVVEIKTLFILQSDDAIK